jgi:flagellar basal body-associated protein FliL
METAEHETFDSEQHQQRNEKKKTIILTLILSLFIIGGIGTWGYYQLFGEQTTDDVDLPSKQEVTDAEKASGTAIYQPTVKVPVTEIQGRLNEMHEYWNDELGYGKWNSYSFEVNTNELNQKVKEIREQILPFTAGPLKEDVETAANKIEVGLKDKNIDTLKMAHRIFHDLDITLNGYQSATTYWEVTETWKWLQKNRQ